ncbi:MAG TPA: IclR family transcriptional regulator [Geobacteraceae bacterium]|nr:IclR family transcriptional regulator [Geobacteraceae bacterium]
MISERNTVYTVQTVRKAFELLQVLAEAPDAPSLAQLSLKVGLSRNKTFRLLATLNEMGLVDRESVAGNYQLGAYSTALAQKLLKGSSVINYAHPIMEELVRKHDEAVYMTVIQEDKVLFVDMVDCFQQIKAAPLVGKSYPFFTNAAGKVMKALDSRDLLEKFFKNTGRRNNVPDLDRLESELQEIRSTGVAVDSGGFGEGISSVAVAVRDYAGKVVGAITMLGPSFRMLAGRLESEIIPSMLEGAELLSEKFGYARA